MGVSEFGKNLHILLLMARIMDNIINTQRDTKSYIRTITIIFAIALALFVPMLNAYAVPQDSNFGGGKCEDNPRALVVTCCWYESDEEGIEIRYCQHCDIDIKTGDVTNNCGEKHPVGFMPSTSTDNVVPNEGKIVDDTKKPLPPLMSGRESVIGNLADQELQQSPSFNKGNQQNPSSTPGEILSNSDNIDNTFTSQEDDDSSNFKGSSNSNDNKTFEDNPPQ